MKRRLPRSCTLAGILWVAAAPQPTYQYPPARKADVVDDYHGTRVADPYRWVEDADSEETLRWVEAQNALWHSLLDRPEREALRQPLSELFDYPRASVPLKRAKRYFLTKNSGLPNQSVLYVQEGLQGDPRLVLEPILIRVETKAGHGGGKPVGKRIEERADIYGFLFWQLGVKAGGSPSSPAAVQSPNPKPDSTQKSAQGAVP